MPPTLAGLSLGLQGWLGASVLSEPGPLGSGILPMGLAGHVCNLSLFLDTSILPLTVYIVIAISSSNLFVVKMLIMHLPYFD